MKKLCNFLGLGHLYTIDTPDFKEWAQRIRLESIPLFYKEGWEAVERNVAKELEAAFNKGLFERGEQEE